MCGATYERLKKSVLQMSKFVDVVESRGPHYVRRDIQIRNERNQKESCRDVLESEVSM